jgi:hypothetical protein
MDKQHLIFQVCVGDHPTFYEDCINSVRAYASRVGAAHIVHREPTLRIAPRASQRSRQALKLGYLPIYEKEAGFLYLERYKKVLILDADVYIRDSAPDIFQNPVASNPFCGVVEREMPLTNQYFDKIRKYCQGQYRDMPEIDWKWNANGAEFFNMGVMLLDQSILPYLRGDTPTEFLRRPEFERFVNGEGHFKWSTDQTLLNWWLKSENIPVGHLDWRWNALYGAVVSAKEAHFVHFFLSAKLPKKGAEIPEIIAKL